MSTTAGYFSETNLQAQRAFAETLMMDGRLKAENEPWFTSLKAILENQTMRFGALTRSDKDFTMEVEYAHFCQNNAGVYTSAQYCASVANEPSTNIKTFTLPAPLYDGFKLRQSVERSNDFDLQQLYATSRLGVERNLLQLLSQTIIANAIEGNLGDNVHTSGKGVVAGTVTSINSAYWNANLVPDLMQTATRNKFKRPYILDSNNLYNAVMAAQINAGNANGSGDARAFGLLKYYADLFNIDVINPADKVTYMIESDAIGVTSKSNLPNITKANPKQVSANEWRWSEPMLLEPRLVLDVHYQIECDTATDEKVESYKFILRYISAVNPTGCDGGNTGILKMVCA